MAQEKTLRKVKHETLWEEVVQKKGNMLDEEAEGLLFLLGQTMGHRSCVGHAGVRARRARGHSRPGAWLGDERSVGETDEGDGSEQATTWPDAHATRHENARLGSAPTRPV